MGLLSKYPLHQKTIEVCTIIWYWKQFDRISITSCVRYDEDFQLSENFNQEILTLDIGQQQVLEKALQHHKDTGKKFLLKILDFCKQLDYAELEYREKG